MLGEHKQLVVCLEYVSIRRVQARDAFVGRPCLVSNNNCAVHAAPHSTVCFAHHVGIGHVVQLLLGGIVREERVNHAHEACMRLAALQNLMRTCVEADPMQLHTDVAQSCTQACEQL